MSFSHFLPRRVTALLAAVLLLLTALPSTVVLAAYENTYVNTGKQALDLVGVAKTQIGYHEGTNNYNKYGAYFGNANAPWCGYFVSWCARQAGIPTSVLPSTGFADGFNNYGTYHARTSGYVPQPGDLTLFGSSASDAWHVSIVERYDSANKRVWLIDGNWSDQVSNHWESMSDSDIAGFLTPRYTSSVTELSFVNYTVPETLMVGKPFSICGLVCSPNTIKTVTVSITDGSGNTRVTASASPNSKSYDIVELDDDIPFGSLPLGDYLFVVSATDTAKTVRWSYSFTVTGTVDMTVSDVVAPTTVTQGRTFCISGVITCTENLSTVSVGVYDASGNYKTGGRATGVGTKIYDISALDEYVSFGSLSVGEYTMRINATSANTSKEWQYPFTVVSGQDTLTLIDAVYPATLNVGDPFAVDGVIVSSGEILWLEIHIVNSSGEYCQSCYDWPETTAYSIASLGTELSFEQLEVGTYSYILYAQTANTNKTWSYSFAVTRPQEQFTISDPVMPDALTQGDSFLIGGVVSTDGVLKTVTVTVENSDGECLTASAQPHAASFDLSELRAQLSFHLLPAGTYLCSVSAATAYNTQSWNYAFTIAAKNDLVRLIGFDCPTTLYAGDPLCVKGMLLSSSPIRSVTVAVFDQSKTVCLKGQMEPNSISASLDAGMFAEKTLAAGQYTVVLTATTADGQFTRSRPLTVRESSVAGDVNFDGKLDLADAALVYAHVRGDEQLSEAQLRRLGVQDGQEVGAAQALKLYRYVSGAQASY